MNETIEPPADIDAENAVVAALMETPDYFFKLNLRPADFYDSTNRTFYEIMPEFVALEVRDLLTLKDLAGKQVEDFESFAQHILKCASGVPSTDFHAVLNYANIVKEKSKRREVIKVLQNGLNDLSDPANDTGSVTNSIANALLDSETLDSNVTSVTANEHFDEFFNDLQKQKKRGDGLAGISTGFSILDGMTGGLEAGKLYVPAARPAMGKSAFAINIAVNMALAGNNVLFFSLEMLRSEVFRRAISVVSGVPSTKIKLAHLTDEDEGQIGAAFDVLGDRLIVSDNAGLTGADIYAYAVNLSRRLKIHGCSLDAIFVDYLQLMRSANPRLDTYHTIGENLKTLKKLAKDLECPVILLSQLSRASESRDDKLPRLTDLRESGEIEQDADTVMFIHRPAYYDEFEDERLAELHIAKNRDGETGAVKFLWDKNTTSFSQL